MAGAKASGWTKEYPDEALAHFFLVFGKDDAYGVALAPLMDEAEVPTGKWGLSLARRTREGFARLATNNAQLDREALQRLRDWADEQLDESRHDPDAPLFDTPKLDVSLRDVD